MNIAVILKQNLNKLPIGYPLGKFISYFPYGLRPGLFKPYRKARREISNYYSLSSDERKKFIFRKVQPLVHHAYRNTFFYKDFYDRMGFLPNKLKSFEDIRRIPIVNKEILKMYSLEERSFQMPGLVVSNTGGSTGNPLNLYTNAIAFGHEWAHIHYAWSFLGFKHYDLRLIFAGRSNVKNVVEYDLLRHAYAVDIYSNLEHVADKLMIITDNRPIRYLHGYPSAIYEFALYCEKHNSILVKRLRSSLKGVFLNSEFPYNKLRNKIEEVFDVKSQSFYGHTERCIFAFERCNQYEFAVLQTYGYAEVVDNELIGTSYNSFGTPLIRYNTEDIIHSPEIDDEILTSFKIKEGRRGEFILDGQDQRIPLTGLIFGRHHKLFDHCDHIQVYQEHPGEMTLIYSTTEDISTDTASTLFDSRNIQMKIDFKRVEKPYKTPSGKVLLKVNEI